jgi:phage tail-like protein
MRTTAPTFVVLDGRPRWEHASADRVSQAPSGIRLIADPRGSLALSADDGSLGGLTLPRGMALDSEGTLYLLDFDALVIRRFDPATHAFKRLPTVGGFGWAARRLRAPGNIAISGRRLYVADAGNLRVQVFDLTSLALVHVWQSGWIPVDLTVRKQSAYILDRRHGRVYRHPSRADAPRLLLDCPDAAGFWVRIAVDRAGWVYLWNIRSRRLDIYDCAGRHRGSTDDAGELRDRFDAPPIRLDHRGRFCLSPGLSRPCARQGDAPAPEQPLAACLASDHGRLIFDRHGAPAQATADEPAGPPIYATGGMWISMALDSQLHNCQWHRIELELAALPPGTQVVVSTYSDDAPRAAGEIQGIPAHLWATHYTIVGAHQGPEPAPQALTHDFLVQSRLGRYLWLKLTFSGDGYATPIIRMLRAHFPRLSYLEYLPAVFSFYDQEGRWFLERFLSIFQAEWEVLEQWIGDISGLFDPRSVPDGAPLAELARWLALPLEGTWSEEQRRALLIAAPQITAQRGTLAGLSAFLQVYVQNITQLSPQQQNGFPAIVEGFRERRRQMLAADGGALGERALWSPTRVGRLQSDVYARTGEARLVSVGAPADDLLREFAHRFRVYVPSAWVRTPNDETMLRRALDAEKPAHTSYELFLVEPRLRVGVQATVGLDTIIGAYAPAMLNESPGSGRLGEETVLGGGAPTEPNARVGIETVLN